MGIRQIRLAIAVRVLGRWAEYTLASKCQLPATAIKGHPKVVQVFFGDFVRLREDACLTIVEPFRVVFIEGVREVIPQVVQWRKTPNVAMVPKNFCARVIAWCFAECVGRPSADLGDYLNFIATPFSEQRAFTNVALVYDHPSMRA